MRVLALMGIAVVLGIVLGVIAQSHPTITDTLWVLTPLVLVASLATCGVLKFDSSPGYREDAKYVYVFALAYTALCFGTYLGLQF